MMVLEESGLPGGCWVAEQVGIYAARVQEPLAIVVASVEILVRVTIRLRQ